MTASERIRAAREARELDEIIERANAFQRTLDEILALDESAPTCIVCGCKICAALARLGSTTCHNHRPAKRR